MSITIPKLEDREATHYVAIRSEVHSSEIGTKLPPLFGEVEQWLGQKGISPSGAPFFHYAVINMNGKSGTLVIDVGFPVASPVQGDDRVKSGVFPAGRYASVVYTGPYAGDGIYEANVLLIGWAKEKGIEWDHWDDPKGDAFRARTETYFNAPTDPDPNSWKTEVAIKVANK